MFTEITFAAGYYLYLLLAIPPIVAFYVWKRRYAHAEMQFSHSAFLRGVNRSFRLKVFHLPFVLRMFAMALLIVALAKPQSVSVDQEVEVEGIDIVIALDISGSMLAEDFQPNRMEAAKYTAIDFVELRQNDRIGLTLFSGQSFTMVPLTTDHALLIDKLRNIRTGMVEDGTAIGDGLATAINRLRESDAVSKVVILLTDGINNAGVIDPLTAAQIAQMYQIRVYSIGVGKSGMVPFPFQTPFGIQYRDVESLVDEALLSQIAEISGGKYFRADYQGALEEIYREIDRLEKSKIDVNEFARKRDIYLPLLLIAVMLICLDFVLRNTWLRTLA